MMKNSTLNELRLARAGSNCGRCAAETGQSWAPGVANRYAASMFVIGHVHAS